MLLKWLGHSCFKITLDDGRVIIADPFDGSVGYPVPGGSADIITISHYHNGHDNAAAFSGGARVFDSPGEYEADGVTIRGWPAGTTMFRGRSAAPILYSCLAPRE